MAAVLDHVFEFVGRNLVSSRSKTRFFHEGWGDLAHAKAVALRSLEYFDSVALSSGQLERGDVQDASRTRSGIEIDWGRDVDADDGYGVDVIRQDASFESPFADMLPAESRRVLFARLRPGRGGDARKDGARRVAILLPCTGDIDEWYRRSIARELLESGVECVIPTIAYYGARAPRGQWRHVIRTVSEAKIQLSVTPVEMMEIARAVMEESGPGTELCVAGVSLGGTMSALTACALARNAVDADSTSVCCIAAANDCTPYTDGSIETRLAWDVLCEQLATKSDEAAAVEAAACWGGHEKGATKEQAREAFLEAMSELNMQALVVEKSVRSAVFITAKNDRFVGNTTEAIAETLQTMTTDSNGYWREDFDGGHLQFIFGRKSVIAPSIKRAFELNRK